jgi:hypothetical protein
MRFASQQKVAVSSFDDARRHAPAAPHAAPDSSAALLNGFSAFACTSVAVHGTVPVGIAKLGNDIALPQWRRLLGDLSN